MLTLRALNRQQEPRKRADAGDEEEGERNRDGGAVIQELDEPGKAHARENGSTHSDGDFPPLVRRRQP
jgi:hypothetical protein